MRDLVTLLGFVGVVPFIFFHAYVGALAWALLSLWNFHRLSWGGLAGSFPYAVAIGGATLVSLVMRPQERRPLYWTAPLVWMTLMIIWMNVTTPFALHPDLAIDLYTKVMKIMLMTYVTAMLIHTKGRILVLLAIMTWSIAFYSAKGGLFTLLSGGSEMVLGPKGSFIDNNTTMAAAGVMTVPYLVFWRSYLENKWAKRVLLAVTLFTFFAIVGSYSRGAFLAGGAMAFFLWLKSDKKGMTMLAMIIVLPVAVSFMPDKYMARMNTIETYDEDASAMGRVNAWYMAVNLAKDHPIVGGGFDSFTVESFIKWAPEPLDKHDSHSNYFQMLGHHGYPGLILFLGMGIAHWMACGSIVRRTKKREDLRWANGIASMTQVSVIGYAVSGLFLGSAYYDYYYFQLVLIVNLQRLVDEALEKPPPEIEQAVLEDREAPLPPPERRGSMKPVPRPIGVTASVSDEQKNDDQPPLVAVSAPETMDINRKPTMTPWGSTRRDVVKSPRHHGLHMNNGDDPKNA